MERTAWRAARQAGLEGLPVVELHLPAGTLLIPSGATTADVLMIIDGRVALAVRTPATGRQTVAVVTRGGVVGDVPAVLGGSMPFDVIADTDVLLHRFARDDVVELLTHSPDLALRWASSLAARLDHLQARLVTLLTKDLSAQVATVLLDHAVQEEGAILLQMPHQTIANLLGARRQSVSRVLGHMRRQGLVRSRYGAVEILDLAGIAAVAGRAAPARLPLGA